MVRYCETCYKSCAKGEYKLKKEEKYIVRTDYPTIAYMNMKSPKETPHFYTLLNKTNIALCLECFNDQIVVNNIKCNICGIIVRPHTQKEHLDINNPIHNCPHNVGVAEGITFGEEPTS